MALPKAAQKQLKDAEKLHAEVYPTTVEDAPDLKEVKNDAGQDPTPAPTPDEAAPAPETMQEVRGDESENQAGTQDWEHKYKVLKGKYDAEVPRLQQSNNAIQGRMSEMETQFTQMMEANAQPSAPVEPGAHLSGEEIEDYGQDMIDVVKKAAREEFEPMVATLQTENLQLRGLLGTLNEGTARDAHQTMLDTLDGQVANWREVNGTQEFLGWLENVDPYSGHKKLDMLRQAFEGNNTSRVMAFFKGYLNENAAFSTRQEPSTEAQPQVNLDTLVAPGRPSEGFDLRAQEGTANGPSFTQADIASFYRDVQRGVYRNDPESKDRKEAEIFAAQNENRIT